MSLDQEDKEIDIQLDKLFLFLDQFDCWWITDIKHNYPNDSCIVEKNICIEFDNVIPINGENK